MKQILVISALIILAAGCKGPLSSPANSNNSSSEHKAVVNEVIPAAGYTYINVTEKRKKLWLAVPELNVSKGDKIYYSDGWEMTDFYSKELKRTFPSVLLLESISKEPNSKNGTGLMNDRQSGEVKTEKMNVSIKPGEGCISIESLLRQKSSYAEKSVRVKGIVTKFNPDIMNRNWIHLQDGSGFEGGFDLTVTSDATTAIGDTVTFEGTISLKKDFGYGYFYEIIMENGKLIK